MAGELRSPRGRPLSLDRDLPGEGDQEDGERGRGSRKSI
jgi:hypothetical protein